jgi:dTDP-4-dehydrorhamnose 3,5-epimerase
VVDLERHEDDRGFFARTFCAREFSNHGLQPVVAQANLSHNDHRGTVRGMHYQAAPAREAKLVRCTAGAIYDVIVDIRPSSPTYGEHFGVELSAENGRGLYIPEQFAHGFQTLADDTDVTYLMSEFFAPEHQRGLRYDDPGFGIDWPLPVSSISEKDRSWPLFSPETAGAP